MSKILITMTVVLVLLTGCNLPAAAQQPTNPVPALPTVAIPSATVAPTATLTPTASITPTITLIPTPTWAVAGPGEVVAPILMYHHVDPDQTNPRYNITPEKFAEQMQALADWGYQTITVKQLARAIINGEPLPPRPVVITFDDGHYSVYKYAYPIMEQHGFVGVAYIVGNRLKSVGFMGAPQLLEMVDAGWEVGSHSFTHSDLSLNHSIAYDEIYYSRKVIGQAIDGNVRTFAYPFGAFDAYLGDRTMKWGYLAAVGLGTSYTHSPSTLFYLARIEVQGTYDMAQFASLLPWAAPPE